MSLTGTRRIVVLTICLTLVSMASVAGGPASATPGCLRPAGQVPATASTWGTTSGPSFSTGAAEIQSYAASPFNPSLLLAENGTSVMRSLDGGCSWHEVFTLPSVPETGELPPSGSPRLPYTFTGQESRIVAVSMPSVAPLAYLLIEQLDPVSRPHVLFSSDRGTTWTLSSGLEDAFGRPSGLAASAADPTFVYLLTDTSGIARGLLTPGDDVASQIHRSVDGGGTFSAEAPMTVPGLPARGIVSDPRDPDEYWVYGAGGLWHGRSDTLEQTPGMPAIGAMDITLAEHGGSRILAFESGSPIAHRSDDRGESWEESVTPGIVGSAASAAADYYMVATSNGVFLHPAGLGSTSEWVNYTPLGDIPVQDIKLMPTTDQHALFELLGRTTSDIYWLTMKLKLGSVSGGFSLPEVGALNPFLDLEPPRLTPNDKRIVIEAGRSKTVDYRLDLPQAPTPLDVFFLVDISGSMQGAINGTAAALGEIVHQLSVANINAWFGVGEYRSYRDKPAYNRVRDVGPPNDELAAAIENLRASGGGDETQLEALYQVATGEGRLGLNEQINLFVAPRQQANFRPEALKVVLHVTDERISEGPPHPSYDQAIGALNSKDIDQIGLAIQGSSTFSTGPKEGLERVASGTGAVAPSNGTDCDGDGVADISGGAALVCVVDPGEVENASAIAPAIVNLLKSLEDRAPVRLGVRQGANLVSDITPAFVPDVNLKSSHALEFTVRYRCPSVATERSFPVTLQAFVPARVLDAVDARVVCTVEEEIFPTLNFVLPPILVPPPAPPQPGTNPQANPQPNPQPQGNPQGALASQEQKQPQLAYVYSQELKAQAAQQQSSGNSSATEQKYEMSRYRSPADREVPPELVVGAGLIVMAFMYASVTLARARVQVQERFRRF